MILINCDQGGQQWHNARAGVITASMFNVARERVGGLTEQQRLYVEALQAGATEREAMDAASYKAKPKSDTIARALRGEKVGDFSDAAKNYAFRLAVERISGTPLDEGFETYSMRRGHDLEPVARAEHEIQSGLVVRRAGFVLTDDGVYGASADGLIGDDEGSEYKCFIDPAKLRQFHIDNDASGIMDQVQGCMWITGRKRWHVGLYCPALESAGRQLWWRVFDRDQAHIDAMQIDLAEFHALVDFYESQLLREAA